MAVVPVCAGLPVLEAVVIGLARMDAGEAETGDPIHVCRQQDAVPVDRGLVAVDRVWRQRIGDPQVDRRALAPAQQRRWQRTVYRDGRAGAPGEVRSEEHTSELQSLLRISYAVFSLKKKKKH